MAQKPNLKTDNFISKIVTDPKQVPDTLMLSGYLGASSEDKHTRLYFDTNLSSYVEIPDDGILHTQDYPADASPFGGSYLWIKKDAVIVHGKANAERTKAKFLEGPIVNDYMNVAAAAQWPQEGGFNSIFCQPTFQGVPCGHTTIPIACNATVVQLPTEQPWCPRTTNPAQCPPPTPNCLTVVPVNCPPTPPPPPTRGRHICPSVIAICDTRICDIGMNPNVTPQFQNVQQQAIPLAHTVPPQLCITTTLTNPACRPTLNNPNCFTRNNPWCPTKTNPWCPTQSNYPPCNIVSVNSPCTIRTFTNPNCVLTHNPPCNIRTISDPDCIRITLNNAPACQYTVNPRTCFQQVTYTPGCDFGNIYSRICPSLAGCPSMAGCPTDIFDGGGFDFGGNPIQY
jgi:hypothetical protein